MALSKEQISHIDKYVESGKDENGQVVKNLFTFARTIGTSVAMINKYLRGKI